MGLETATEISGFMGALRAGSLLKGNQAGGAASCKWECCQLGVKWELVTAEKGRMCLEKGLQSTASAHGRRKKMLYSCFSREAAAGLCSSPMTRCPVAASSPWLQQGAREPGWQLGVAASRGPAGAGGCPREGVVHAQETQQQDLLPEPSLAQTQPCNGSRPLGSASPGTI